MVQRLLMGPGGAAGAVRRSVGTCVPVTAQGSPQARFRRAIDARSVLLAELSAREMGSVQLEDALALVLLYAAVDDAKFERAAGKWLSRLTLERGLSLAEIQLAAGALQAVGDQPEAAVTALRLLASPRRATAPAIVGVAEALGLLRP